MAVNTIRGKEQRRMFCFLSFLADTVCAGIIPHIAKICAMMTMNCQKDMTAPESVCMGLAVVVKRKDMNSLDMSGASAGRCLDTKSFFFFFFINYIILNASL